MSNIGYIQVTRICNHDCLFCSNPDNGRMKPLEEVKKAVDDFVSRDYRGIIFTGGEPTIYPKLVEAMQYAKDKGMASRLITNGSMLSNEKFLKKLIDAGLEQVHISLYSYKKEVHDRLSNVDGAYKEAIQSLKNLAPYPQVFVALNCVINRYNAKHLDKNVLFIAKNFPHVRHFIWNNMDTSMIEDDKFDKYPTWANPSEFKDSLYRAVKILKSIGKTFRVEKLPLCYMEGFEEFSTETRKIVQEEERRVYFLDDRDVIQQEGKKWKHSDLDVCKDCDLYNICAGLHRGDTVFDPNELKPVKKGEKYVQDIRRRVFDTSEN